MAVKIRLTRVGSKKNPIYRVVVADSRSPRDGRFIEIVGRYNPQTDPSTIELDEAKIKDWMAKGAQPTAARLAADKGRRHQRLKPVAELLEWLARRLVDEPDAVRVETEEREDAIVFHLHVAPDDVGKVIGKQAGSPVRSGASFARAALEPMSATSSRLPTDGESDVVLVGRVGRPHGVDGAFVVEQASEDRESLRGRSRASRRRHSARVVESRQVGWRAPRDQARSPRGARSGAGRPARRSPAAAGRLVLRRRPDRDGLCSTSAASASGVVRDVFPGRRTTCSSSTTVCCSPSSRSACARWTSGERRILLNRGFTD